MIIDFSQFSWWMPLLVLLIHTVHQLTYVKIWPDWDTASHLYFASLRYKSINFLSSYMLGVKWALPRLYALVWPLLKNNPGRFRIFNLLAGALFLSLLMMQKAQLSEQSFALWIFAVLVINSGYVNAPTSAAEFISAPLALMAVFIPPLYFSWEVALYIQTIIICMLALGFKAVDFSWLLPVGVQHMQPALQNPWVPIPAIIIVSLTMLVILRGLKEMRHYNKTRGFLHDKNKKFWLTNPVFIITIIIATCINFKYGNWLDWSILTACVIALMVQKMLLVYFWYPLILANFIIVAKSGWIYIIEPSWLWWGIVVFFIFNTTPLLLFACKPDADAFIRFFYLSMRGRKSLIKCENEQVQWLKRNMPRNVHFYFWGTKTVLPLMANLTHVPETFYNHNHLFYWADIDNPEQYAINFIRKSKPSYILEADPMNGKSLPLNELAGQYKLWYGNQGLRVFCRNDILTGKEK